MNVNADFITEADLDRYYEAQVEAAEDAFYAAKEEALEAAQGAAQDAYWYPVQVTVHLDAFSAGSPDLYSAASWADTPATSYTFQLNSGDLSPVMVAEEVFTATNLQRGDLWDRISGLQPEGRAHTALSVGDSVTVHGVKLLCAGSGWVAQG
ncbi:hypothetical protein [Tessaracoccus sp.]